MNPESYDVALTPGETVRIISDLTVGILNTHKFDPRSDSDMIAAVCAAERIFNMISADVFHTVNERPDLFRLSCDQ